MLASIVHLKPSCNSSSNEPLVRNSKNTSMSENKKQAVAGLQISSSLFDETTSSTEPKPLERTQTHNLWQTYDSFMERSFLDRERSDPSKSLIGSTRKGELEDLLRYLGVKTNAEICDDTAGDAAFLFGYEWAVLLVPELIGTKKFAYFVALFAISISHEASGAVGGDVSKLKVFSAYGMDIKVLLAEFETPEMPGLSVHHWIGSVLCNYAENAKDIDDPACVDFFHRLTLTDEVDKLLHHRAFSAYMQGGIILVVNAKGILITPLRRAKIDACAKTSMIYHDVGNIRRHAEEQTATNIILATKGTNTTPEKLLLYARNVYMSLVEDKEEDPQFTAICTRFMLCFAAGPNFMSHYMKYNPAVLWTAESGWIQEELPVYRRRVVADRPAAETVFKKAMKGQLRSELSSHPSRSCPVHFEIPISLIDVYDDLYFSVMGKYGFGDEVCTCKEPVKHTKSP